MKKFLLYTLTIIFIFVVSIIFIFKFNFLNTRDYIFLNLSKESKLILRSIKKNKNAGFGISHILKNFINDYNVKFLPATQHVHVKL